MKRRFVIGDIHGCIQTLNALLEKIALTKKDEIVFVGDYIDRGPDSKAVVDKILYLIDNGFTVIPLRGNHEQMLIDALNNIDNFFKWLSNGSMETLLSFGIELPADLPEHYLKFFKSLHYYKEYEDFIIVHAGMNFRIGDPFRDKDAMLWTRCKYIDTKAAGGRRLIVGHTPTPLAEIKKRLLDEYIRIDGGCVYSGIRPDSGYLCALELNSMELFYEANKEYN